MCDVIKLQEAGAFCLVLEGVKSEVGQVITQNLKIPVIGIGSGVNVDGQVLVWSDMLGFFEAFKPKFVRQYLEGAKLVREAVQQYVKDVKNGDFPKINESY